MEHRKRKKDGKARYQPPLWKWLLYGDDMQKIHEMKIKNNPMNKAKKVERHEDMLNEISNEIKEMKAKISHMEEALNSERMIKKSLLTYANITNNVPNKTEKRIDPNDAIQIYEKILSIPNEREKINDNSSDEVNKNKSTWSLFYWIPSYAFGK